MTQNDRDPAERKSDPEKPGEPGVPASGAKPKKKKRWLLKSLLALVVLIVLLVLLAPTIASMGFVREIVVGKVNDSLNGKLAIKDWSFGWFSGVHIQGVELSDENNIHLLSVASIDSPISLLKAATGTIDLGDATIKGVDFNAVIDEKGQINFSKIAKSGNSSSSSSPGNSQPGGSAASSSPSKLPNIKGNIHLEQVTGTVQDDADRLTVSLPSQTPLNVTVGITGINDPITDAVDLGLQVDEKNLVRVKLNGTVSAIQNNQVAIDKLTADQTLEISQGDLAPLTQVLKALKLDLNVTGKLDGKIEAKVATQSNISANGGINLADVSAGGDALSGDTVSYRQIKLSLNGGVNSSAIKFDLPVTMDAGQGAADQLSVHADATEDSLEGMADALKVILQHEAKAIGVSSTVESAQIPGKGVVSITANFDLARAAGSMPHMLHLEQGAKLSSGELAHSTTLTMGDGKAVLASQTQFKNFTGTSGTGAPLKLADITTAAQLTIAGGSQPSLQNIHLDVNGDFATVSGGGDSLSKLTFHGSSDLSKIQQQFGQLIDFDSLFHAPAGSHVSLAGALAFDAHSDGDPIAGQPNVGFGASFGATGLKIVVPGRRTIDEPNLAAAMSGNFKAAGSASQLQGVTMSVKSPAIDFAMGGDADLGDRVGGSFAITRGNIDLRLLQEEFGGMLSMFVPPAPAGLPETVVQKIADNSVRVATGAVTISGKGKFDQSGFGFDQPLAIVLQPTDLTVADEMGTVQTLHVPTAALGISGNGTVDSQSQVATLKNLALTATVGTADSPLLAAELSADVTASLAPPADNSGKGMMSAQRIELNRLDGDLPRLQAAVGPLISLVVPPSPAGAPRSAIDLISQNVLVCTSGKLTGSMLGSCDGKTMTIQKPLTVTIADLTMQQENTTPISHETISAAVGGSLSMDPESLHATVSQLSLKLGDQLTVQEDPKSPIDVQIQSGNVQVAQGGVQIDGDIAKTARLAETFGGVKPNTYPYQGQFHLSEVISKVASEPRMYVKGGGAITKFAVLGSPGTAQAGQVVFSEDNVTIDNPLTFDFDTFTAAIDKNSPVAVVLNSSGALSVRVSGTISDLPLRRQIADDNPLSLQLTYDLAKLWPIIKPMLSASSQQSLADLQIAGKQTRSFIVTGSYPADKPSNDAMSLLKATGNFTVDSLSTQGISIQNLDVPITLSGGVVQLTYADGKLPQPASCNSGAIDIGGIQMDLRTNLLSMPRASQPSPQYVLKNVSINPAMSKSVIGKFLNNPAFVNANTAQGLLSVGIVNANQIELSNLSDASPQNKGTAVVIYSVTGLRLGSQLLAAFGNDSVSADIRDSNVKYAMGRVAEDTTMMIDGTKPLRFVGTVILATNQFAPMTVYIPGSLFAKAVPGQYQQFVPDQIVVPMKGDMNKPQIDIAAAVAETVKKGAGKAIINGLLQGLQKH